MSEASDKSKREEKWLVGVGGRYGQNRWQVFRCKKKARSVDNMGIGV